MSSTVRRILWIGLALLLVAGLWHAVAAERERRRLAAAYAAAQQSLAQLQQERAQLSAELTDARTTIDDQAGRLANLQQDLQGVQRRLDSAVAEVASLQQERSQLQQRNASLAQRQQQLEAKLASIKELRLAIHDIKRKMRDERWEAWRQHIDAQRVEDQQRLLAGNRGYVVRSGVPTLGQGIQVRVHVLQPESH